MQRLWQSFVGFLAGLSTARRRFALVAAIFLALSVLTFLTSGPAPRTEKLPAPIAEPSKIDNHDGNREGSLNFQLREHAPSEPPIAYSAELSVVTRDFTRARTSMEDILERHRGYAARLRMVGHPSSSILSATLKVPSSEYPAALADLKSVGNVEQDEEAADEIIQQRGDIEARLENAQNNERRLQQLLKDHDGKIVDLAAIERQLAALHNDIVQMELERHSFDSRVVFSNIHFSLREEREAPVESLSAQFGSALRTGFSTAARSLSAILIVLVTYGPPFLLWAAVLFFPARYLWRRARVPLARGTA